MRLPDPAAVAADDAAIEDIRGGRDVSGRDRLIRALAAWRAAIDADIRRAEQRGQS